MKIPVPYGLEYLPFQVEGILKAAGLKSCLLADEPGLGKTIQAIGVANLLDLKRLLVICPAGLRLNWKREIEKWHLHNHKCQAVMTASETVDSYSSTVISYDLATKVRLPGIYDLVVADEGHYLKNPRAERTKMVLGRRGKPGLIHRAPRRMVLTGTPIPNRVNEIFPVLSTLAYQVIDRMSYRAFLNRYAIVVDNGFTDIVVGVRNEQELYERLRSGFMIRRLKKDVLKDLPEKTYKMVIFPENGTLRKILEKESQFDVREIIKHGAPVGSALPEVRREMGEAKAPMCAQYIEDLLEDGVQKVVVYAHHRSVVSILKEKLQRYQPVVVTGETPSDIRQHHVDAFMADPHVRIFIGNILAAGVGVTLTSSKDVVFVESSWVPGENEQAEDRCHRVGQKEGVVIHYLVVEKSLDAAILGAAAGKRTNINKVLDGG